MQTTPSVDATRRDLIWVALEQSAPAPVEDSTAGVRPAPLLWLPWPATRWAGPRRQNSVPALDALPTTETVYVYGKEEIIAVQPDQILPWQSCRPRVLVKQCEARQGQVSDCYLRMMRNIHAGVFSYTPGLTQSSDATEEPEATQSQRLVDPSLNLRTLKAGDRVEVAYQTGDAAGEEPDESDVANDKLCYGQAVIEKNDVQAEKLRCKWLYEENDERKTLELKGGKEWPAGYQYVKSDHTMEVSWTAVMKMVVADADDLAPDPYTLKVLEASTPPAKRHKQA